MNRTFLVEQTDDVGKSCFCCAEYTGCGVEMELLVEEFGGHPLDLMKITCTQWDLNQALFRKEVPHD